ncbi:hypothetical protein [Micromonospora sp. CA-111912]|uniref:hypothetical protein n=1 Tax=Micromonospora sp. CA-111912 TaxID=3239955 RepID=UPI003D949FD5
MVSTFSDDREDPLGWLAFAQSGVLTTAQATCLLGPGVVRGRVRSGRWRSVCRGVLLTGNGRLTRDQQLWVAVLATGPRAVLAGATAAAEAGVRGLRREPLHVLVPATRRAGRTVLRRLPVDMVAVVVHRTSVLPRAHLQIARPPRTTTARALVDAAGWARTVDEAQAVLAAGCQQRRVTPEEIRAVVDALPRAHRRHLVHRAVDDIAGGRGGTVGDRLPAAVPATRPAPAGSPTPAHRRGRANPLAGRVLAGVGGARGRRATGSCASPPGSSAPAPTRSRTPSTAPCWRRAGTPEHESWTVPVPWD